MSEEIKKEVKQEKKVNEGKTINAFVKASDMTTEDLKKLQECKVVLSKRHDKKTDRTSYRLRIVLDNGMEFEKANVTKNEYLLVSMKRNLDQKIPTNSFKAPVRFTKGQYVNDDDFWIRYEVFLCNGFYIGDFFGRSDKSCVKLMGNAFSYPIIESTEKFDKSEDIDFDKVYND